MGPDSKAGSSQSEVRGETFGAGEGKQNRTSGIDLFSVKRNQVRFVIGVGGTDVLYLCSKRPKTTVKDHSFV